MRIHRPRISFFQKYFAICSMCVLVSVLVLGVSLLAFSSRYFGREKFDLFERNAKQAAILTANSYSESNYGVIDKYEISMTYTIYSESIGADFFLVDLNGKLVYGHDQNQNEYYNLNVPQDLVTQALTGKYEGMGQFGDFYSTSYYIVGVPVVVDSFPIGVLFVCSSAGRQQIFINALINMFLFSAILILIVASILIYFLTSKMVRPLKDMLLAVNSFSSGDFSKRVTVSGYDEIGQLAMAFNNMAGALATTESSRRSFVANVSHELKTPMTTIGGFVDGILDGTVPEEKRTQYLQVVSNEVKRLTRLVHSMLDTARIEAGELKANPTCFDISETLRQTIFTFEQMIDEKKLEIRGLEVDKVIIQADKDLMHQVVYNLIENAVKFVDVGGYIQIGYHSDEKTTFVSIRNSSKVIDKQDVAHLFERFYKSDKSRSLNKNGVGLGLHIARSIINYHNREIVVRTLDGEYVEFEFGVPRP